KRPTHPAQVQREKRIPSPITPSLQTNVRDILREGIHCSTSIQSGQVRTTYSSQRGPPDGHRTSILNRRGCHEGTRSISRRLHQEEKCIMQRRARENRQEARTTTPAA